MTAEINGVTMANIDVYPVGVLADLLRAYRDARSGWHDVARISLRYVWRRPIQLVKAREWRALRMSFNGYLAEVNYPPEGLRHNRCGHGWTKRRAVRRLGQYLANDNPGRAA